ncbi:MAG: hypothetical protein ACI9VR_001495 [Cognaticolwellia sp.]
MLLVLLACSDPILVDSQDSGAILKLGFDQISVSVQADLGSYSATCTAGPDTPERYRWTLNGSPQDPNIQVLEGLNCQDEVVCTVSAEGVDPLASSSVRVNDRVELALGVRELGDALRCEKICGTQDPGPFLWTQGNSSRPGPILWPQDREEEATCTAQGSSVSAPAATEFPRTQVELLSKDEAWLAFSSAWIGDIDGDGGQDLALGMPYWNTPRPKNGGVAVVRSGTLGTQDSHSLAATFTGEGSADLAGWALAPAGDVDGDGLYDLLVGVPGDERGGYLAGAVALFTGADLASGVELTGQATRLWTGDEIRMWSGTALAGGVDLDQDGSLDVLVGAYGADGDSGAVFLFSAESESGTLQNPVLVGPEGSATGLSLAIVGDSDGDGIVEWAAGAPLADGLYWGQGALSTWVSPSSIEGGRFGWKITGMGDWDGDGLDDAAVSEPYGDTWIFAGGEWMAQGQASTEVATLQTAEGPILLVSHEGVIWSVADGEWTTLLSAGASHLSSTPPLDFGQQGTLLIGDHTQESAQLWLGLP